MRPQSAPIAPQETQAESEKALALNPMNSAAMLHLGVFNGQLGRYSSALLFFDRASRLDSLTPAQLYNQAIILQRAGKLDDAIESLLSAVRKSPTYSKALDALGVIERNRGNTNSALRQHARAVIASPDYANAYLNWGVTAKNISDSGHELWCYIKAAQIEPANEKPLFNLGVAHQRLNETIGSRNSYEKYLVLAPNHFEALLNLGALSQDAGHLLKGLELNQRAVKLRPRLASAHVNLGNCLKQLKQFRAALASYDEAIRLDQECFEAYVNKSMLLLLCGDLREGFRLYQRRLQKKNVFGAHEQNNWAEWKSGAGTANKRILVDYEQGLGDSIQFCRFVPLVEKFGAKVFFRVQNPLATLMSSLKTTAVIISDNDPCPGFDIYWPLMSLPYILNTTVETIPNSTPYLSSHPEKIRHWEEKLCRHKKFKVGLTWNGGHRPNQPQLRSFNEQRNIPLDEFASYFQHENIDFFSLQKGAPAESEIDGRQHEFWKGGNFYNFAAELNDFSDTAALIENLDLIISVDTSTAHLAGALGKPTWVLNRYDGCWRWLEKRNDSPWYQTALLFRQQRPKDWSHALDRASRALSVAASNHRAEKNV